MSFFVPWVVLEDARVFHNVGMPGLNVGCIGEFIDSRWLGIGSIMGVRSVVFKFSPLERGQLFVAWELP